MKVKCSWDQKLEDTRRTELGSDTGTVRGFFLGDMMFMGTLNGGQC